MKEPRNSWEISYVISCKRPRINLDLSYSEAVSKLGHQRIRELNDWMSDNFSYKWFIEHI